MTIAFTAVLAVVPALLLLRYFCRRDLNPEPRGVLVKTFFLGVVIVVPVLVVVLPFMVIGRGVTPPLLAGMYTALFCAAIPEEFFKFVVLTRYSARSSAFDEPMDGVVYGATASLGFATLENILYVGLGGWTVALARGLTAVPVHACMGAILGYYVGQARFGTRGRPSVWLGLLVAVILHWLYDVPLLSIQAMAEQRGWESVESVTDSEAGWVVAALTVVVAVLVTQLVWTGRIVRRLRREQVEAAAFRECDAEPGKTQLEDPVPDAAS